MINTLYNNKQINYKDANKALLFTHFSNPLFILSTVGVFFLHNNKYGLIILISHYLGNIIIGIIIGKISPNTNKNYTEKIPKSQKFSNILINSIKKSIDTLLLILGSITIFLILSTIIANRLNLNIYTESIIKGLFEITMGINSISMINIPDIYKVIISTMFISFGGLAVHLQILSVSNDININYHNFLVARIIHSILSGLISYILFIII